MTEESQTNSFPRRAASWTSKTIGLHLLDTTSILAPATPIFALWERAGLGKTSDESIDARIFAASLFYIGAGGLYGRFRDTYYDALGKLHTKLGTENARDNLLVHDTVCSFVFGLPFNTAVYLAMGDSLEKAVVGGVTGALLGAATGRIAGASIDIGRELIGAKEQKRLPEYISRLSLTKRLGIAAGLAASGVLATEGVYKTVPEGFAGIVPMVREYFSQPDRNE